MVKKGVCLGGDWNPGVGGRSKLSLKTSFLKNRMIHKVATKTPQKTEGSLNFPAVRCQGRHPWDMWCALYRTCAMENSPAALYIVVVWWRFETMAVLKKWCCNLEDGLSLFIHSFQGDFPHSPYTFPTLVDKIQHLWHPATIQASNILLLHFPSCHTNGHHIRQPPQSQTHGSIKLISRNNDG